VVDAGELVPRPRNPVRPVKWGKLLAMRTYRSATWGTSSNRPLGSKNGDHSADGWLDCEATYLIRHSQTFIGASKVGLSLTALWPCRTRA
jgi:hypothetical protein